MDAGPSDDPDALPLLDEVSDLEGLVGDDGSVKFLLPVAGAAPRAPVNDTCAFQDTARFLFHIEFLRAQAGGEDLSFEDYIVLVLKRATRVWWGGAILWRPELPHPLTEDPGTLLFNLYTEDSPGNRMELDDVRAVFAELTLCAPAFAGRLAFVPSSNEQRLTTNAARAALAAEGIGVVMDP